MTQPTAVFWFRRDLRLEDNVALYHAQISGLPVLPVFIFDDDILEDLDRDDARVGFIHETLEGIHRKLKDWNSGIRVYVGRPVEVWNDILSEYEVHAIYSNEDYEPYGIKRDKQIQNLAKEQGVAFFQFKDHVVQDIGSVVKADGLPYTVYTPYKNQWLSRLTSDMLANHTPREWNWFPLSKSEFPDLNSIGFKKSEIGVKPYQLSGLENYEDERDYPGIDGTSNLSPHLRFGTISVRTVVNTFRNNAVLLSEVIWREFFMQILWHFPDVVTRNFKSKYNGVQWRNNNEEFDAWCTGMTGYPMVDAGMRELNATGYMHNRVRMITAGFLCKHLLIDWRWGEAYFAKKLLDYELSSNNGNWQWSAGTGCDAAPYFRIFNPDTQVKKFDAEQKYIRKWLPDWGTLTYPRPIVDHKMARERALKTYRDGISE